MSNNLFEQNKKIKEDTNFIILLEGKDDARFLSFILNEKADIKIPSNISVQIFPINGYSKLSNTLKLLTLDSNFENLERIAFIFDADDNFESRMQSILNILKISNFISLTPKKKKNLVSSKFFIFRESRLKVGVFLFPNHKVKGELEDLILNCIEEDETFKDIKMCNQEFEKCLSKLPFHQRKKAKLKLLAYRASMPIYTEGFIDLFRKNLVKLEGSAYFRLKNFIEEMCA